MPRKKTKSFLRDIKPDQRYNSVMVQRLINKAMLHGKKYAAQKHVYSAMEGAASKLKIDSPLEALETAMRNITPRLETRSRRVGGANYQIPFEVKGNRQVHLPLMWLIQAARDRRGMDFTKRLMAEIVDAYGNTGAAVKKKEDTQKMAEANRAFAHFARF